MPAPKLICLLMLTLLPGTVIAAPGAERRADRHKPMAWQDARAALRAAGALAAAGEFKPADGYLSYYQQELPSPYRERIASARVRIAGVATKVKGLDRYELKGRLAALCMALGAYRPALELAREVRKLKPEDPRGYAQHLPWCLLEYGRLKEAAREYKRKALPSGKRQLELATRLRAGRDGADTVIAYVEEHYLRARKDYLGALDRLSLSIVRPHGKAARVMIHEKIFSCFAALGDARGMAVWEKRFLKEFAQDPLAASVVHMNRARRAARIRDYDSAVSLLAEIMSAEVPSGGGDALTRAFIDRRHRAALLASQYCEKKQDLRRALEYAVSARDDYKPWSRKGAAAAIAARKLAVRIRDLSARLARAGKAQGPKPGPGRLTSARQPDHHQPGDDHDRR